MQQRVLQEKSCNCRNSKCMKLYCECFSSGLECTKSCRCTDCHNHRDNQIMRYYKSYSNNNNLIPNNRQNVTRGCSCRKSFCVKKYCECYQEGVMCGTSCKCVDCQNSQSLGNRNVVLELKKGSSATANNSIKHPTLYPIVLSQSPQHLQSLLAGQNPLQLTEGWLNASVGKLFQVSSRGVGDTIQKLVGILREVESGMRNSSQRSKEKERQDISQESEQDDQKEQEEKQQEENKEQEENQM